MHQDDSAADAGEERKFHLGVLEPLAPDLWAVRISLKLMLGDVGSRMTVIRLSDGGLLLHSPVEMDAALEGEINALGTVRWIVAPNLFHHFFVASAAARWPDAKCLAARGLAEKLKGKVGFSGQLDQAAATEWKGEVLIHQFEGASVLDEVVFFHPASRTLILTDVAFNVTREGRNKARFFHRLVGATGRFGPTRVMRTVVRDKAAARRSCQTILKWNFDRVVVAHGEVLETGGRVAFERGFDWLLHL